MIEVNWKDRVPTNPGKIKITTNDGIISGILERDDAPIEAGTPLNKVNLETPVGEIRLFTNERDDEKYLLCDGSNVNIADYPELVENISNIQRIYTTHENMFPRTILKGKIRYFESVNMYVCAYLCYGNTRECGIATSEDGIVWTERVFTTNLARNLDDVKYFSELGIFVAYGANIEYQRTCQVYVSKDCINWTMLEAGSENSPISEPEYIPLLGKVVFAKYDNNIYGIDGNGNKITISSNTGSKSKIIQQGNTLYASFSIQTTSTRNVYLQSSTDCVTWADTPYKSNQFDTYTAVQLGTDWYSYCGTHIGRLRNGVASEIYTTSDDVVDLIRVNNFLLAITVSGDLFEINDSGVAFIRNVGMEQITDMEYASLTNDILIFNGYTDTLGATHEGKIKRINATTLELRDSADVLGIGAIMSIANNRIYVGLKSSSSSLSRNYDVFDNSKISLPNLADTGYFPYIKALGGE